MFYRRKILLALLESFNDTLSKIELQKYLFLVTEKQEIPAYEFVPYKFGGYSFTAWSDLNALCKKGFIRIDENNIIKTIEQSFIQVLKPEDSDRIYAIKKKSAEFKSSRDLMHYVYTRAPYYALNSTVKENYLTVTELDNIRKQRPSGNNVILATIGYEGISIEAYMSSPI